MGVHRPRLDFRLGSLYSFIGDCASQYADQATWFRDLSRSLPANSNDGQLMYDAAPGLVGIIPVTRVGVMLDDFAVMARTNYVRAAESLGDAGNSMRAAGSSEEAIGRWMNSARNSLKDIYRGPLASILKGWKQPTYDELILKGKSIEQIQQSAMKTNPDVNYILTGSLHP